MIPYPNIDPDLVQIGPLRIRWYGVMYVLGFIASYFLIQKQERSRQIGLVGPIVQDLIFYLAIGLILGGRLGYVLFYEFNDYGSYLRNPLEIFATWHGGMSFHGGFIGVLLAAILFCRRRKLPFAAVADSIVVTTPIGLGLGRIGNFINAELLGLPTDLPWGMIFPGGGPLPRHPSQLYEAFFEGVVLFALLWVLRRRPFPDGMMVVFFLFFYGIGRFFIEFVKEPDPQIGYLFTYFTMGQILCAMMVLAAILLASLIHLRSSKPEQQ
ncbi:MAG: prolipoprotein diacylglyceryl transferase [Deltaproteobacteria bacterium]|nr:prolipoprotein diacylglyceryl transferase [Deltaproteobacteria bacterium]